MISRRQHSPYVVLTLIVLGIASLVGLGYAILTLAGLRPCPVPTCTMITYGAFFAISGISVIAIFRWKRWGVYALVSAAGSVALIDLLRGATTQMDFLASVVVIAIAVAIFRHTWPYLE
ncbi:MAG: hypothetical protein Kow0077_00870 [Anaerolineae bacterium]